jgi:hypothetical protein
MDLVFQVTIVGDSLSMASSVIYVSNIMLITFQKVSDFLIRTTQNKTKKSVFLRTQVPLQMTIVSKSQIDSKSSP